MAGSYFKKIEQVSYEKTQITMSILVSLKQTVTEEETIQHVFEGFEKHLDLHHAIYE